MMHCSQPLLVSSLLFALAVNACAQLESEDLAIQRLPTRGKKEAQALVDKLWPVVRAYANEHSRVSPNYPYPTYGKVDDWGYSNHFRDFDVTNTKFQNAQTLYDLIYDGRAYVAGVASFASLRKAEPHCVVIDDLTQRRCQLIAERHETCHLFLFDPQTLAIQSVGAMPIKRDNRPMPGVKERGWWNYNPKYPNDPRQIEGWPRCDGVLAVAPAKVVPNALLITLSYIDSGAPLTKHEDEYPPQFKSTSLLRFSTDGQGTLKVTQDDTCLGNPNTYASISAARKALTACQARQPSVSR